jgi:hypothetical protein
MAKTKDSEEKEKKASATEKIIFRVFNAKTSETAYEILISIRIISKDGKAKAGCPFRISYQGILWFEGETDDFGNFSSRANIIYHPELQEIELEVQVSGSGAHVDHVHRLPSAQKIELSGRSEQKDNGLYVNRVSGIIRSSINNSTRAHCPFTWKGNDQNGQGVSDKNGRFVFTDEDISRTKVGDEICYTVSAGTITEEIKIQMPLWKKDKNKVAEKFNNFPNWKYNRSEALNYVVRTILIFGGIIAVSMLSNATMSYLPALIIGIVLFAIKDKDGKHGIIFPIIAALISLWLTKCMVFASGMIIATLPVYIYEEMSKPIDLISKASLQHPQNPYPKWPVAFGLAMSTLLLILEIAGIFTPDKSYLPSSMVIGEESIRLAQELGREIPSDIKIGYWTWLWQHILSLLEKAGMLSFLNWLAFSLILALYRSPGEFLSFFMQNNPGKGDVAGFGNIIVSLKGAWEIVKDFFRKFK